MHLFGAGGLSGTTLDADDAVPARTLNTNGGGLIAGGGYDFFVGRDFSMGPLAMLQYELSRVDTSISQADGTFQTMAVSLSFAMTYN